MKGGDQRVGDERTHEVLCVIDPGLADQIDSYSLPYITINKNNKEKQLYYFNKMTFQENFLYFLFKKHKKTKHFSITLITDVPLQS